MKSATYSPIMMVVAFVLARIQFGMMEASATRSPSSTTQVFDGLTGQLASHVLLPGVAEDSALKLLGGTVQRQATMMAYNDVFWMMGRCFVFCLPFLLFLGRRTRSPVRVPSTSQRA